MFKEELEVTMRMMGTPTLADITPDMVITKDLSVHSGSTPNDYAFSTLYQPIPIAQATSKL